jgi:hypothetical protein
MLRNRRLSHPRKGLMLVWSFHVAFSKADITVVVEMLAMTPLQLRRNLDPL